MRNSITKFFSILKKIKKICNICHLNPETNSSHKTTLFRSMWCNFIIILMLIKFIKIKGVFLVAYIYKNYIHTNVYNVLTLLFCKSEVCVMYVFNLSVCQVNVLHLYLWYLELVKTVWLQVLSSDLLAQGMHLMWHKTAKKHCAETWKWQFLTRTHGKGKSKYWSPGKLAVQKSFAIY